MDCCDLYDIDPVTSSSEFGMKTASTLTATATTFAPSTSHHSREEEASNECPLLQGVKIKELPPRFQRLLSIALPSHRGSMTAPTGMGLELSYEFYPGHIPLPPILFLMIGAPFSVGLAMLVSVISQETKVTNGVWVSIAISICFFFIILYSGIAADNSRRMRRPLFAKNERTKKTKPWPGDWKAGTYLLGSKALFEYDGYRCWLFPVEQICRIDHLQKSLSHKDDFKTYVILYDGDRETRHSLGTFDEPLKGKEIRRWHRGCLRLQSKEKANDRIV